ncbi:MAG: NAD(P)-dependent oxidoreductase [Candidatus Lambdaproteobacteria bacterium]|nr:NAD(P)-dependent oxidoreductase [Candidatus Lambdaproteobacteria bacterium]
MDALVGFIGLGRMGMPMVQSLARAGHRLAVFDTSPALCRAAGALPGVQALSSAADVAARTQVLFSCLPNNDAVHAAYLGQHGVAQKARAGLLTCDCSTVAPQVAVELGQALVPRGVSHLDTPMLGSQPQAVSGEIFFIVSGERADYERARPYLGSMGKQSMFVGGPGTANKIKLIHNALGAVNSVAVAESLAMCVRGGVDVRTFYDVVRSGGGMAYSTYFDRRVSRIADGDYSPTFTLELMRKDVSMAAELAESWGVAAPIMALTREEYDQGVDAGWGGEDFSAVSHVIERRLGISLSQPPGDD